MKSVLKQIQADILGTLQSCDFFEDITIQAEDKADITNIITTALAPVASKGGKGGICVIIEEPEADAPTTLSSPYLTLVKIKVTILENIAFNRTTYGTNKPCYLVAESIQQLLFQQEFDGVTQGYIWPGSPAIRSVGAIPNQPMIMGVEVLLEAHAALPQVAKCATPTISNANELVTIESADNDVVLFYSIDGTFPSIEYTEPFETPIAGSLIRAVATHTGWATSNTKALEV